MVCNVSRYSICVAERWAGQLCRQGLKNKFAIKVVSYPIWTNSRKYDSNSSYTILELLLRCCLYDNVYYHQSATCRALIYYGIWRKLHESSYQHVRELGNKRGSHITFYILYTIHQPSVRGSSITLYLTKQRERSIVFFMTENVPCKW